jgi:transposase-like protein
MLVPRQEYSRELKMAAMREIDSGKGMAEVARMHRLSPQRLEAWKGEWRAKGELVFPGKGARPQTRLDAERIAALERKIAKQTIEIDFLQKALLRFRKHPLPAAGNGDTVSMSKSKRRPKRGSRERALSGRGCRPCSAHQLIIRRGSQAAP